MTEGQKTRHLGRGMKPRSSNAEPVEEAISETATEGHQDGGLPPERTPLEEAGLPASAPTNLPVTDEVIPEQDPIVAETNSETTEISRLTELMNQSRQQDAKSVVDQLLDPFGILGLTGITGIQGAPGGLVIPTAEEIAAIAGEDAPDPMDDEVFGKPLLGEQPNKSFNMVVNIEEGYVESIRQQAESDGITPEEWVSLRLHEYLADWWAPARSK